MFRCLLVVKGVGGVEAPLTREAAIGTAHLQEEQEIRERK